MCIRDSFRKGDELGRVVEAVAEVVGQVLDEASGCFRIASDVVGTVSYTHLDVYKRQYEMRQFANIDFRGGKTGKKDSRTIASYGISSWYKLVEWQIPKDTYFNLDLLNRTYMNAKKQMCIRDSTGGRENPSGISGYGIPPDERLDQEV